MERTARIEAQHKLIDASIQETQEKIKKCTDVDELVELNDALVILKEQRDNIIGCEKAKEVKEEKKVEKAKKKIKK